MRHEYLEQIVKKEEKLRIVHISSLESLAFLEISTEGETRSFRTDGYKHL